jgi:hypothetical protein
VDFGIFVFGKKVASAFSQNRAGMRGFLLKAVGF